MDARLAEEAQVTVGGSKTRTDPDEGFLVPVCRRGGLEGIEAGLEGGLEDSDDSSRCSKGIRRDSQDLSRNSQDLELKVKMKSWAKGKSMLECLCTITEVLP